MKKTAPQLQLSSDQVSAASRRPITTFWASLDHKGGGEEGNEGEKKTKLHYVLQFLNTNENTDWLAPNTFFNINEKHLTSVSQFYNFGMVSNRGERRDGRWVHSSWAGKSSAARRERNINKNERSQHSAHMATYFVPLVALERLEVVSFLLRRPQSAPSSWVLRCIMVLGK